MQKIKLKLTYSELQVLAYMLTQKVYELPLDNYANKCILAVLLDFGLKQLMPHTYISYLKTKSFSMPMSVACGIIHLHLYVKPQNVYQDNVMRTLIMNIEPKVIR